MLPNESTKMKASQPRKKCPRQTMQKQKKHFSGLPKPLQPATFRYLRRHLPLGMASCISKEHTNQKRKVQSYLQRTYLPKTESSKLLARSMPQIRSSFCLSKRYAIYLAWFLLEQKVYLPKLISSKVGM